MSQNKQQKIPRAEIGVLGGSGFYDLIDDPEEFEIEAEFGRPSDKIMVGKIDGKRVAFIARHGKEHSLPPHKIPYKANLMAFKQMGVKRVISPAAVGSLNPLIKPGDFVICDQFVNWNCHRDDTFYNGQAIKGTKKSDRVAHISVADPYCKELRRIAVKQNERYHQNGTVVVIQGPRFSTRAESKFFSNQGWDIINMTIYPEVVLARELGMCYLNIGLVTDWDAGLEGNKSIKPVSFKELLKVFKANNQRVKELIFEIIKSLPKERKCGCDKYINEAIV